MAAINAYFIRNGNTRYSETYITPVPDWIPRSGSNGLFELVGLLRQHLPESIVPTNSHETYGILSPEWEASFGKHTEIRLFHSIRTYLAATLPETEATTRIQVELPDMVTMGQPYEILAFSSQPIEDKIVFDLVCIQILVEMESFALSMVKKFTPRVRTIHIAGSYV